MDYKLKKKTGGKTHVHYTCPSCGQALDSALEEAGQDDECPACRQKFRVPGETESRAGVSLGQRIAGVEKQNRRLKWGMTALCVVGVAAFVVGQAAPEEVPDVIRAKQFEVVNEAGVSVVTLRSWELGGWIETRNRQGKHLFTVAATNRGDGSLGIYSAEGKRLVGLLSTEDGLEGMIFTHNAQGRELVSIGATRRGQGAVVTYNGKGTELVRLAAVEGGDGAAFVRNAEGKDLLTLTSLTDGTGAVSVYDPTGRTRRGRLTTRP